MTKTSEQITARVEQINAIIAAEGLADEYGEIGGLIASYDEGRGLVIEDEAYAESFPLDVTDERIREYLAEFSE